MRVVYWLLAAQALVCVFAGGIGAVAGGPHTGLSALLGGLISAVPTAWFVWRGFRHYGSTEAGRILQSFQTAEIGKMVLTMVLFAVVFSRYQQVNALALFATFIGVQLMFWVVPPVEARIGRDRSA